MIKFVEGLFLATHFQINGMQEADNAQCVEGFQVGLTAKKVAYRDEGWRPNGFASGSV